MPLASQPSIRDNARAACEDAIERGTSTVLHEEVLRGIHMLSVANIPAGETIEVRTQWVTTLSVISATGHLRIPVTVGDVYGRSPFPGSDDIKTGGETQIRDCLHRHSSSSTRFKGNGRLFRRPERPRSRHLDTARNGLIGPHRDR